MRISLWICFCFGICVVGYCYLVCITVWAWACWWCCRSWGYSHLICDGDCTSYSRARRGLTMVVWQGNTHLVVLFQSSYCYRPPIPIYSYLVPSCQDNSHLFPSPSPFLIHSYLFFSMQGDMHLCPLSSCHLVHHPLIFFHFVNHSYLFSLSHHPLIFLSFSSPLLPVLFLARMNWIWINHIQTWRRLTLDKTAYSSQSFWLSNSLMERNLKHCISGN